MGDKSGYYWGLSEQRSQLDSVIPHLRVTWTYHGRFMFRTGCLLDSPHRNGNSRKSLVHETFPGFEAGFVTCETSTGGVRR